MTRSDLGVIICVYAICVFFLYMTLQLKAAAQIYPLGLIGILAVLNTLYLFRCIWRMREAEGKKIINNLGEIFSGFQSTQFFFVSGACIAYIILLYYLGFYLSSLVYMIAVMLFLKVKQWQMWLSIVLLGLLIYGVFTIFLKVPLPRGLLFS